MSWMHDYSVLGHNTFIVFIECKIEGRWDRNVFEDPYDETKRDVLSALDGKDCIIHLIEPDGLRRILHFTLRGTVNMRQNILSYHSGQVDEITVDEKEQSGKEKTRDKL